MNKIRLLYVVTKCTRCGPINVLLSILHYLDFSKFEFYLITTAEEEKDRSVLHLFKEKAVEYQYIPLDKKKVVFGKVKQLQQEICRINPDVIHSTGIVPDLAVSRICPQKQLIVSHANVYIDNTLKYGKPLGWVLAKANIYVYKRAHTTIACSKSLSELYKKQGLSFPFIRNGINIEQKPVGNKRAIREELGLSINSTIFVYTAAFIPRKNHEFLIRAFKELPDKYTLLLIGDGELFDGLKRFESSNIIFAGRKENVIPYLLASDYFVSSSLQEGMPMAVLEALACGIPVLLSDIEQHKELFEINEGIGCLYKNNSVEDLDNAVNSLLKKDYHLLSESAYNTAKIHFNAESMSEKYQVEYSEIAKQSLK